MYTIRKQFKFELAHQLDEAYSKCCKNTIHGHSYICEVFFSAEKLDDTGMVIDFGKIKNVIGSYMDSWDHALVIPDTMRGYYLESLRENNENLKIVPYNPTAENMAEDIYKSIKAMNLPVSKVRLHETTTGWAEYTEKKITKIDVRQWQKPKRTRGLSFFKRKLQQQKNLQTNDTSVIVRAAGSMACTAIDNNEDEMDIYDD